MPLSNHQSQQNSDRYFHPSKLSHDILDSLNFLLATFKVFAAGSVLGRPNATGIDLHFVDSQLSEILKHVRALRNATLPIMRLPAEVLATIFKMTQVPLLEGRERHDGSHAEWPGGSLYAWMDATLVCRYWHDVAVSSPSLWTNIVLDNTYRRGKVKLEDQRRLNQLALRNSRQNNLTVAIHMKMFSPGDERQDVLEIMTMLPRMQELHFLSIDAFKEVQWLLQNSPAPHLQTLVLGMPFQMENSDLPENEGQRERIPALFDSEIPSLRSLAIHDGKFYVKDNFRNLKQLHLFNQYYRSIEDIHPLLDLLDGNPGLEDLMFSRIDFDDFEAIDPLQLDRRRIRMPNLARLSFGGVSFRDMAIMLCYLLLPKHLALTCDTRMDGSLSDLLAFDAFRDIANDITKVRVSFNDDGDCMLCAVGPALAFRVEALPFQTKESQGNTGSGIASVLADAEELWAEHPSWVQSWAEIFEEYHARRILDRAPALVRLSLLGRADNILAQEAWLAALQNVKNDRKVRCPLLQELHVLMSSFRVRRAVVEMLHARYSCGHPLGTIYCYVPPTDPSVQCSPIEQEKRSTVLQPFANTTVFVSAKNLPSMQLPSVCNIPSTGRWVWPTWQDTFYDRTKSRRDDRIDYADDLFHDLSIAVSRLLTNK